MTQAALTTMSPDQQGAASVLPAAAIPRTAYAPVHRYGLGDLLHEQARSRPDMVAVIDGSHRFTYRQFDERVNRLATVLRGFGVEKGDRILWLGQNSFRVMEVLLASARIGAIICPANWRSSVDEVVRTLDDLQPKVVFWQEAEIGEVNRKARFDWPVASTWIQHDGDEHDAYETLIATAPCCEEYDAVEPDTPLLAIYTAAFSGRPGAALLSHESLMITGMLAMTSQQIDEQSGYLVSGPMFHVGVLMGTLATFISGGRCAFVARVDAVELLEMIDRERLTHAYIAQPTIVQMREANADGRYDVSSLFATPDMADWKLAMVMPVTAPFHRNPGCYGQTEVGGTVVLACLGGTAAGRAAPFIQVRIADDAGNELPPGETGEILARGPLVMCGYWNRPEENARRVINGWHRTNDLGKRLPDGSIAFVGPKVAMIKTGVENVYPAEVESCLRAHEAVADVCVIGVPDPKWDQNVKAVVVLKAGSTASADDLISHCRERMASYKKPKIVAFVETLPKGASGFTDRDAVNAAHGGGGYPSVG